MSHMLLYTQLPNNIQNTHKNILNIQANTYVRTTCIFIEVSCYVPPDFANSTNVLVFRKIPNIQAIYLPYSSYLRNS
jgi:hypothetical protein